MSKRKREDDTENGEPGIQDRALRIQTSRLKTKLDQGFKSLHSALKLARGFERQKLGRRQKNANNEPHTLLRLREEVIVLKQLPLDQTARNYLMKQLVKTKRIKEHPIFSSAYGSGPVFVPAKSSAEANVIGRLFNSAPVKQVMPTIMATIFSVLRIPQVASRNSVRKDALMDGMNKEGLDSNGDEFNGFSRDDPADKVVENPKQPPASDFEEDELLDNPARDRLASSESESDDEDSGQGSHSRLAGQDLSISPSPSEASDRQEISGIKSLEKTAPRTVFLPSLSLGGYYSGSESEDIDTNKYRGSAQPKVRKNRRGQRARQKLAEMKYGENAKHLEKKKDQNVKSAEWDSRRGAISGRDHTKGRFRKGPPNRGLPNGSTSNPTRPSRTTPKQNARDDPGSLHPSWEAAKKRKTQDQSQAKFAGKRITFD
ncbi:uncharacterized protein Z518_07290 [Rhinocladiella mackenziei CBS 650.93]|uniref:Bud22 domain-containing protein n=1 Tax=Rhinocladiella mackenziei CBS 650.93 TaxID=1442369 RepID=A0A0D2FNS5_9EURO|nr:uncharacterized protein Z518_07290 [Rhinocladiella mackenziei CBS 650.93]KIX03737.1 hypothetical protein Z518_07290 [Rhinocladiella mackenziei CBS 650.93]